MTSPTQNSERLFREEALAAQRTQLLGQIILTPRVSLFWVSATAALMALTIILFLIFGSHTRRVSVTGQLVPAGGLIRVYTPQAGVVLEKHVSDGQAVTKGQLLYILSSDRTGEGARELQADIARQVGDRKLSLEKEIERSRQVQDDELASLTRRADTLRAESSAIAAQMEQQRTRISMAEDTVRRYRGLADQDFIAREELLQKEIDLTEQRSRQRGLERDALGVRRELDQVQQELVATRLRHANLLAQLEREVSSTDQQLTEVEARRRVLVTAPETGRATLVAAEVGQTMDINQPLLTLLPDSGELRARLYAPSSSIGFVKPGDTVLLRYQAFPYQKFGQQEGTVETVSTSAVASIELAGLPAPAQNTADPLFAIQVKLRSNTMAANGEQRPLQAGMQLEADILQERRKLYEWMLEPLFSVTRRIEP